VRHLVFPGPEHDGKVGCDRDAGEGPVLRYGDNARRANVQTLWDYWSTFFRVRRLTLYDFETGEALSGGEPDRR